MKVEYQDPSVVKVVEGLAPKEAMDLKTLRRQGSQAYGFDQVQQCAHYFLAYEEAN